MKNNLKHLKIFAFTHRKLDVVKIGLLHIEPSEQTSRLQGVKAQFGIDELQEILFVFCSIGFYLLNQ